MVERLGALLDEAGWRVERKSWGRSMRVLRGLGMEEIVVGGVGAGVVS